MQLAYKTEIQVAVQKFVPCLTAPRGLPHMNGLERISGPTSVLPEPPRHILFSPSFLKITENLSTIYGLQFVLKLSFLS